MSYKLLGDLYTTNNERKRMSVHIYGQLYADLLVVAY